MPDPLLATQCMTTFYLILIFALGGIAAVVSFISFLCGAWGGTAGDGFKSMAITWAFIAVVTLAGYSCWRGATYLMGLIL